MSTAAVDASGRREHDLAAPLLVASDVVKEFPVGASSPWRRSREVVHAVSGVSLEIRRGETLGLVGETGCGKSTLARCLARLYDVTSGSISFDGTDITASSRRRLRPVRREIQMVFQDPYGSLNPRRRVGSIIGDPLAIHGDTDGRSMSAKERAHRVQDLMELVGLNPEHYNRFPADFSGGQRQRIGLARALALRPRLLICDEPVSALDVSIQAQMLNLLIDLQEDLHLTYLFITHDLSVVRHISDRIAVMYLGRIVETAPADELFEVTRHPYSKALLSALPVADPQEAEARERIVLVGDLPSPVAPPSGCRFHPRCPKARHDCVSVDPDLVPVLDDPPEHRAACLHPLRVGEELVGQVPDLDAQDSEIVAERVTDPGGA
ncbi:ATP-binding cassette domain-containing protein [Mumia sp. zg.B53]|uniref:ABC transporter ATP-binding protein n=1 Tax=unclassified Mumia TaxID=2621872 RepID=UPI001C6EB9F7|nr:MULTISPECIES: oligopeptide/dipeptide ABC transporter ATP-binding protein [unclassified Mumia]MBW9205914.1 ATP-binding cassette domain-containing protein [Mumia sp. zg.B17]MBW9208081.1 ATP-binding cassette domain-containing protein [Mumia sp. zg.B21]MBW9216035.1 ATP-binding cassette domain-containing protein [Mumia sp. zg.B53]MDD9347678.1 ATP-binding cassette domain-containing protein [Mumia sp.]